MAPGDRRHRSACRLALEHGVAINLGGGFHHASAAIGVVASASMPMRPWPQPSSTAEGKRPKSMVVDLDAHQGNGTAAVFRDWPWASILDAYQKLFPSRQGPEDYPIPLPRARGAASILTLSECPFHGPCTVRPDLVIYNAGSDPFIDDPLAGLGLTMSDLAERDLLVVSMIRERSIPVAMVLSGGYSTESWKIHADGIEGILTRFDRDVDGAPDGCTITDPVPPARRCGQTAARPDAEAATCYRAPASPSRQRSKCETRRHRD